MRPNGLTAFFFAVTLPLALACSGSNATSAAVEPAPVVSTDPVAPPAAAPAAPENEPEPEPAKLTPAPAAASVQAGHNFAPELASLFRVAACGGSTALAAHFDARTVRLHCKRMRGRYLQYNKRWTAKAKPYIAGLRPPDVPATVVYPFGGGDLATALVSFPNATEVTTLSLEAAGDPRSIITSNKNQMRSDLSRVGHRIGVLFGRAYSSTKHLMQASHSKLPGTLIYALAGMAAHGFEPTSLRYFTITDDGSLRYLELADIPALERAYEVAHSAFRKNRKRELRVGQKAKDKLHPKIQIWRRQKAAFENVEIGFRRAGTTEARTYRHIVANLDNNHLSKDNRVIKHLRRKGKVSSMTKAASFLLWMDEFSIVRSYLLDHVQWMVSDATGLPPGLAMAAGFEQTPHGVFRGPMFRRFYGPKREIARQFTLLWKASKGRLPFQFGYGDIKKRGHLMVTRKKTQAELAAAAPAVDFAKEAAYIQRLLACSGSEPPAGVNAKRYERHCVKLKPDYEVFRTKFADKARRFIGKLRPANAPSEVVYPFGGGDMLIPPATYPKASVITTISLESSGDPRRLRRVHRSQRHKNLQTYRQVIGTLLRIGQNRNNALKTFEIGSIPGQLAFSLAAATAYGYAPVSLRYFRIRHDGTLYYLNAADIVAAEPSRGRKLERLWINTDFSVAFRHMEIRYRRVKPGPGAKELTHRHIAANLHDSQFVNSGLRKHLERKGKIAALVKASSYLMWRADFSGIRNYLLGNMSVMISDASAILPRHAAAAGFEQTTYGTFSTPYLPRGGGKNGAAMRALFRSQSQRPIDFRFGYSDTKGRAHLIVTVPKTPSK